MQQVLILRCMSVPMSVTLGHWGVPSDVICAWLHGLPIALALALPRVAGSTSFNVVAFLVIIIFVGLWGYMECTGL